MKKYIIITLWTISVLGLTHCKSPKPVLAQNKQQKILPDTLSSFSVRAADEWTTIFYRKHGWFGADGIFSINLNGVEHQPANKIDKVFMYFSDTMTGKVIGNDSVQNFKMVNNSYATLTGISPEKESVEIYLNTDKNGSPTNYFSPNSQNSKPNEYYWFGDGFVNQEDDNSINIFGYRVIDNSEKSWDFELTGVTLIIIPKHSKAPFIEHTQIDAPLFMDIEGVGKGTFGSAIYVNTKKAGATNPDGFLYIYGLLDPNKKLVVARVRPKNLRKFDTWRYWDGKKWNKDINRVKPITNRVSNELSLTAMEDGRFLLVFQEDGIGNHTAIRIAESFTGPFGPIQRIWKAPEVNEPPGIIPYNAKAHPVLSTDDELLISYNTISFDYFNDILKYPHMYRPRFFWLQIINE
jgi:hypothetical protein